MGKRIIYFLLCVVIFIPGLVAAYQPTGSLEELYRLETLPLVRPGVKCKMFSSYDRTGGNDDGFLGTYSRLLLVNRNSLIAEMEGAGCVHRIWFTHSVPARDGLLDLKGEHLMVFLDGSDKAEIDVPLEKIFSGELERFPKPLVGSAIGGFYCYVPIPYQDGCKIVVEGEGVRFYQVSYSEFPEGTKVKTFSMKMSSKEKKALANAVKVWSSPGDLSALGVSEKDRISYNLNLEENKSVTIELPQASRLIRGVFLKVNEAETKKALSGKISFTWDDADTPAIEAPFAYFFGHALDADPFQSLLVGVTDEGFYNFVPMPYIFSAKITVTADEGFQGTLSVVLQPLDLPIKEFAYLHANFHEELPTESGLLYTLMKNDGCGHFVGVFLTTEGKGAEPRWLEGDEKVFVGDELLIHGTGTEDYFNCGWYALNGRLNQPGSLPLHGFTVYRNVEDRMQAAAYRWHITDPIPYVGSISFKLEHGPQNNLYADYRSVVFFYDVDPGKIAVTMEVPMGDECIDYLRYRIWQLSTGDLEKASARLQTLMNEAKRELNKTLLEGLATYIEGLKNPTEQALEELDKSLDKMERLVKETRGEGLYEKPEDELTTESLVQVPNSLATAQMILQRARYHLARNVALVRGFEPGDEIIVEARDSWGERTPEPFYSETPDFTDSFAKVDDIRLLGQGARFTYGNTEPSGARFTPEFPGDGLYEVFVIFSYGANAGDTRYLIRHADGATTVPLEQRGRPGTPGRNNKIWHSLGSYNFMRGLDQERGSVTLWTQPGLVRPNPDYEYRAYADSVRFKIRGRQR